MFSSFFPTLSVTFLFVSRPPSSTQNPAICPHFKGFLSFNHISSSKYIPPSHRTVLKIYIVFQKQILGAKFPVFHQQFHPLNKNEGAYRKDKSYQEIWHLLRNARFLTFFSSSFSINLYKINVDLVNILFIEVTYFHS